LDASTSEKFSTQNVGGFIVRENSQSARLLLIAGITTLLGVAASAAGDELSVGLPTPDTRVAVTSGMPPSLSLDFTPLFTYPMGQSGDIFTMSGAARLAVEYSFPGQIQPFFSGNLGYGYLPTLSENSLSVVSAEAGGGICFWLGARFGVRASAAIGGWLGTANSGGELSAHASSTAALGLRYVVLPNIDLGIQAGYRYDLGLYQGFEFGASAVIHLTGVDERAKMLEDASRAQQGPVGPRAPEKGRGIEISNLQFSEVFPVFHKYYDDHPVGAITLANKEGTTATGLKLTFLVKQFMDSAKECPVPSELAPGARQDVSIMALLTEKVLEVTEATKIAADLVLDYRIGGIDYRDARTVTIRFFDRNAMTHLSPRKTRQFCLLQRQRRGWFANRIRRQSRRT
jgi:hypothetical protein